MTAFRRDEASMPAAALEVPAIVPMMRADVPAVAEIARQCFPVPWGEDSFADELRREVAVLRVLRPAHGAAVCGFVHLWHVADEAQIMNMAIGPGFRRRGLGRRLMQDVVLGAGEKKCRLMTLEVRRSNIAAVELYAGLGFARIGIRQRYYSDNGEDAVVMHLQLPTQIKLE